MDPLFDRRRTKLPESPAMRPLERLLALTLTIAAIALLLHSSLALWCIAASFLLVILHAWLEGPHWQLAPAYLAACLLLIPIHTALVPAAALALVCSALAFSWALPMFQLPKPAGPYPVGTRILNLTDPARDETHTGAPSGPRRLVVQLWYPAATNRGLRAPYRRWLETKRLSTYQAVLKTHSIQDAPIAAGTFPVVLFNHAWGGFRNRCTYSVQDLASHGYLVFAISHTGNTSLVALEDGTVVHQNQFDIGFLCPVLIPYEERLGIADTEMRIQVADCRFLLDTLDQLNETPGHPLHTHVDLTRVGTYGYSFGGSVSAELALEDPRVACALQLDGVLHGAAALEGLPKPFMAIDSLTVHVPDPFPPGLDPLSLQTMTMMKRSADAKTATLARHGGYRLMVDGMKHENFSDSSFMSPLRKLNQAGTIDPRRAALILNRYVAAFFDQTLRGTPSPLLATETRTYPEAKLTIHPSPTGNEPHPATVSS
jgi:dienelactone hydrolase